MIPPTYKKPLIHSIILHGIILLLLLSQSPFKKSAPSTISSKSPQIIHATAINIKQLQTIQQKQKVAIEKAAAARKATAKKNEQARKKRLEQKRLAAKRAQQQAARKKAEKLAAEKKAAAARDKQLAARKQAAALAAKKTAEKKAKLAALQKQQAEEAKKQLQQQLATEQARIAKAQATQQTVNQYTAMILTAIQNHFYSSVCGGQNLSCQLSVSLDQQGNVTSIHLVKSSGNSAFDRMAQNAVGTAAPFPLPDEPDAKAKMQQLNLLIAPCQNN